MTELTHRQKRQRVYYQTRIDKYGKEFLNKQALEYRNKNVERSKENLLRSRKSYPERHLFNKARARCNHSGVEFAITKEDIIIPDNCPLLGIPISQYSNNIDYVPSLDRIDNSKGYIKGNIWVISFLANRMKNTATQQQLTEFSKNWLKLYEDIG